MGDHFFALLPPGHAIRTMPLAATRALLLAEPAFAVAPAGDASESRRQYATVAWALGATYSVAAVAALPKTARVYLARIFGVAQLPAAPLLLAGRIDVHRTAHHPAPAAAQPPPAPSQGAGAGGGGAGGAPAGGAAGPPPPGDDTGGFATALLSAAQVTALLTVPVGTLRALLDSTGVPHNPAQVGSELRVKCAAAA